MKTSYLLRLALTLTGMVNFVPAWAESCNSEAEYFQAVAPFNSTLTGVESSSFSSPLCGQDVTVSNPSGQAVNIAAIPTQVNDDGSLVYANDVLIEVGDQAVFNGKDFTREDLDKLLVALGAEVQSEATIAQTQQVNRQTYNTIAARLMNAISYSFIHKKNQQQQNKAAASADNIEQHKDWSFWSEFSYANIEDDRQSVNFNTDLYQLVAGVDKRFNQLIIGSALTYSHGDNQQTGRNYSSNSIGITPYIAYQFTDYLFLSGLLGYNYTGLDSRSAAPDSDLHEFTTEGNINLYKVIDRFVFKGRIGVRYTYGDTQLNNGRSGSSDSVSAIGDLQIDYLINQNFIFYIGSQYEYLDINANGINSGYNDGVFYFRSGLEYMINQDLAIGGLVETDLSDNQRNLLKGGVNIRLSF